MPMFWVTTRQRAGPKRPILDRELRRALQTRKNVNILERQGKSATFSPKLAGASMEMAAFMRTF